MTAAEKLVERFKSSPADFTWDELVRLLRGFGYELETRKGSGRAFVCEGRATVFLHEPHPGKIVKKYAMKLALKALQDEGLI